MDRLSVPDVFSKLQDPDLQLETQVLIRLVGRVHTICPLAFSGVFTLVSGICAGLCLVCIILWCHLRPLLDLQSLCLVCVIPWCHLKPLLDLYNPLVSLEAST